MGQPEIQEYVEHTNKPTLEMKDCVEYTDQRTQLHKDEGHQTTRDAVHNVEPKDQPEMEENLWSPKTRQRWRTEDGYQGPTNDGRKLVEPKDQPEMEENLWSPKTQHWKTAGGAQRPTRDAVKHVEPKDQPVMEDSWWSPETNQR